MASGLLRKDAGTAATDPLVSGSRRATAFVNSSPVMMGFASTAYSGR
jgi:hypothetical protein